MLDRFENGREFDGDQASASFAPTGIRNLGIAQGNQGGVWVLPAFSPEVPMEIRQADAHASSLARFLLLAHKKGIKLPESKYTTTSEAMTSQFSAYALAHTSHLPEKLPLGLTLTVADGQIELAGWAQGHLDIYKLKKPIERLNAVLPGLGWFISDTIGNGHSKGMSTYDPSRISSLIEHVWFYAQTDTEMVAEVLGQDEDPDEIDEENMERARQERGVMPSNVLESFGGHKNLLNWNQTKAERSACASLNAKQVKAAVKALELLVDDRTLLLAALEMCDLAKSKADKMVAPQGWFIHEDDGYGLDSIGAMAFVVWDDAEITCEAVQHYEEFAMNGDGCSEQILGLRIELDEPASWEPFINAYKLLIKRYAAFSKLIGALPKGE